MSSCFIIHGLGGHPKENWFPWLKAALEQKGHTVIVPAFPHADHPQLGEWMTHFKQYEHQIDEQTIMVGHSLGAAFILNFLESFPKTIRAAFLVAPVSSLLGNDFDPLLANFVDEPFDWAKIKSHCGAFHLFHSDNDPYIKLSLTETLAQNLGTTVTLVEGAGHFNAKAGYVDFPQLLKKISDMPVL